MKRTKNTAPSILSRKAPDLILPEMTITVGNGKRRKTHTYPAFNFTEEARRRGTVQTIAQNPVVTPVKTT